MSRCPPKFHKRSRTKTSKSTTKEGDIKKAATRKKVTKKTTKKTVTKSAGKKKVTKKKPQDNPAHCKLTPEMLKQCKFLYSKGFTDKEVAKGVGVHEATINRWKLTQEDFYESTMDWKKIADLKIEKSLRDEALGYEKTVSTQESHQTLGVIDIQKTQYYRASVPAIKLWLQNRKTAEWSNDGQISVDISKMPTADLIQLATMAMGKLDEDED